jgi:hypothetical protein
VQSLSLPLRLSRTLALAGAPLLVIAETARRWHQLDEPAIWPAIFDDYLVGAALLAAAWCAGRRPRHARAALAAAWAFGVGLGYSSVFGHATHLDEPDPSSLPHTLVFAIILSLWLIAIAALVTTLGAPDSQRPGMAGAQPNLRE